MAWTEALGMEKRIRLGVSTCLLGESVRYDGGHQLDRYLRDILGQYVDFVPVCPEVECGFGIPRESFRLTGNPESPRLVTSRTRRDYTERMLEWARKRVSELEKEDLCGFVFKGGSPSSGMERVKVYTENGMPVKKGRGMFAGVFMDRFPLLPVEEDGRLHDAHIRENFIERIFSLRRWRESLARSSRLGALVDFHTDHKLLLLSHSPKHYREMGKLVASAKGLSPNELYGRYEALLMTALQYKTTIKKNVNVLQHMMGYFKKQLSTDEKQELLEVIGQYAKGYVPLIVPITLINHYVRKYGEAYLGRQVYLNPHPVELKLRNHV
jgi:uncharacterized protein YbgA (DUF1722 family)/uncharacterized protein YbbK (DUF523 family)